MDYLQEMIFRDNLNFESWIQEMAAMRDDNVKNGKARHIDIKELYEQLAPTPGKSERAIMCTKYWQNGPTLILE